LFDVLRFILGHFGIVAFAKEKNFWSVIDAEREFQQKTVSDVLRYPNTLQNIYHPIRRDFSALSVVEMLAREPSLHRVVIINDFKERKLINLIT
ncbi:hypothetical protein ABTK09_19660, partial [Acinetobacter baumannii]